MFSPLGRGRRIRHLEVCFWLRRERVKLCRKNLLFLAQRTMLPGLVAVENVSMLGGGGSNRRFLLREDSPSCPDILELALLSVWLKVSSWILFT